MLGQVGTLVEFNPTKEMLELKTIREWVREAVVNKYVRSELLINRL